MIKKLFFSLLFLMCISQVFSEEENVKRMHSLYPDFGLAFNIEPYIPSDFVLHPIKKGEEFLWMPDGFFEKYIADPKPGHHPFIQIFVYMGTKYKGAKKLLEENGIHFSTKTTLHWGDYEVTSVKMNPTADDEYMAYVNLKKDGGRLIMFHLNYYRKLDYGTGNKPIQEDLDFWNDFLNKTKSFDTLQATKQVPFKNAISTYLKKANVLMKEENYKELHFYLKTWDVQQDPEIQNLLGSFHYNGMIFEKDYAKAAFWWEKGASNGNAKAQSHLAELYFKGQGVEKDHKKGMFWLNKAIAQNDAIALDTLGEKYDQGDGPPQDYQKAFKLYEKSDSQGYIYAKYHLGMMYLSGKGTKQDFSKGFKYLQLAADQGIMEAQFDLGVMYLNGEGITRDMALGSTYIELSARQGFDEAQYALGMIYSSYGSPEAHSWFEKAAAQGNQAAKLELQKLMKI